jgi:para-nitrobenzyl esterase
LATGAKVSETRIIVLRRVIVENGLVEGLPAADPRITSFKGIPFAAPPVGENRWRAPQPAKNWDGILYAYKFAPISMQPMPGEDPENIHSREWNEDPDRMCFYDQAHSSNKGPDDLMKFLIRQYLKKHN